MSARLNEARLASLPAGVERPRYQRQALPGGVVHLGLGAFHRAHQAPVFDALLGAGHAGWGVVAVGVRSHAQRDRLGPQDGLYALLERDGRKVKVQVCGSIVRVLVAADQPDQAVAAIADPACRLVTLTITEKGYDPGESLVWGILARALARRRGAAGPLSIASCDNLAANGERARAALLRVAADPALADWICEACAFPSSMVDRITPATTDADLDEAQRRLGLRDEAAVVAEPFWQWVIEDRFAGRAPPLAEAGVDVVADVAPFERAKLRLLNAAHSALAYAGLMAGFTFVHQAIASPPLQGLVERLWDEASETLAPAPGPDLRAYRAALLRRFSNPSIAHRLDQIAEDGSRKLPQRLIATLAERTRAGAESPAVLEALAAWLRCLHGLDQAGRPIRMRDPNLAALRRALAAGAGPFEAMAAADMLGDAGWVTPSLRAALAKLSA